MEDSIVINRPLEEVFAYLTDVTNWPRWNMVVGKVEQTPPGPLGKGTKLRAAAEVMGRVMQCSGEILEYDPNTRVVQKMRVGPAELQTSWLLEPVEAGTKLTIGSEGKASGAAILAGPLLDREVKKQIEGSLTRLKAILEE